jgi:hypothetical protein
MKTAPVTLESAASDSRSRWDAVDFLITFNTRDKRLGLLTETLAWTGAVAFFRHAETETHYLATPTESDQRYHKTLLAALIAEGERLLSRIQRVGGLPENLDGVKAGDVDAMVEELRNTHAQWYGGMTTERRAQILEEVFRVAPA